MLIGLLIGEENEDISKIILSFRGMKLIFDVEDGMKDDNIERLRNV